MFLQIKLKFTLLTLFSLLVALQVNALEPLKNLTIERAVYENKLLLDLDGLGGFNDNFGGSMDTDGNRLIVGAYGAHGYGAVVIYELENKEWKESAILQSSNKESRGEFGRVVALSGNTAFVTAFEHNRTQGVICVFNFDGKNWIEAGNLVIQGSDDFGFVRAINVDNNKLVIAASAVSVFEKDNDTWLEKHTLLNEMDNNNVGYIQSVSISGDYILLGAPNERYSGHVYLYEYENKMWQPKFIFSSPLESSASGSYGKSVSVVDNRILIGSPNSGSNESGHKFGMAFLYQRSESGEWQTEQIFEETGNNYNGQFGSTVKLLDDKVLIGSWDSNIHDFGYNTVVLGAVYLYEKLDGENTWHNKAILSPNANEISTYFGSTIEFSNNSIFIGSPNGLRQGSIHQFELNKDTWSWSKKFELEKGPSYSQFGNSVSVFGNKVLVGSKGDITNGYNFGSASIFELKNGQWVLEEKLFPSDGVDNLKFGTSVSLSEKYAVISAGTLEDMAVYIFELVDNIWIEKQKIDLPSDSSYDGEGLVVDIDASRIAIGSSSYESESGIHSGAVFIFERLNSQWLQTAVLTASDKHTFMGFGGSISLSGNRILIGARYDDMGDVLANYATGSVYIFDFINDEWLETTKLIASDAQRRDRFGYSVSLLDDRLLVGASAHSAFEQKGKAYIFELNQENIWQEKRILFSGVELYSDGFGRSVSLTKNHHIIGAPYDRNDEDTLVGAVYAFDSNNNWSKTKIDLENTNTYSQFGGSIDVFDNRIVAGDTGDNEKGVAAGATHILNITPFNKIQSGHSALWYNPEQSGHGLSVYLHNDNLMTAIWYVYDNDGNPLWLFGQGTHDGYKAELNVKVAHGAMFPPLFNSSDVELSNWGKFEVGFTNCDQGLFKWLPINDSGFESGELIINRINTTQGLPCADEPLKTSINLNAQPTSVNGDVFSMQANKSALWYDPEQSGHGISVYMLEDNRIIVIWYVYDNNGKPIWLFGTGVHDGEKALLDVISTTGAMFPPNFNQGDVDRNNWGQFELEFNDCNNGMFKWLPENFTGYVEGEMAISRIINTNDLNCD